MVDNYLILHKSIYFYMGHRLGHPSLDEYKLQEYLETILYLLHKDGGPVKTGSIASEMGVSQPSVTEMLQRLSSKGLIEYTPYHGVSLTPTGMKEATLVKRKHQVLECFLVELFGYSLGDAHEEACLLEHSISDRMLENLCTLTGHPKVCPDGNPIPSCSRHSSEEDRTVLLSELKCGERARVVALFGMDYKKAAPRVKSEVELLEREAGVLSLLCNDVKVKMDERHADRFIVQKI